VRRARRPVVGLGLYSKRIRGYFQRYALYKSTFNFTLLCRQIWVALTLQGLSATGRSQSGSVFGSKESSAKVQIDAWQQRLWVRHLRAAMCVKDRTVRSPPKSSVIRDPSRSTAQSTM